MNCVLGILLR